jgi:hypothetical protein
MYVRLNNQIVKRWKYKSSLVRGVVSEAILFPLTAFSLRKSRLDTNVSRDHVADDDDGLSLPKEYKRNAYFDASFSGCPCSIFYFSFSIQIVCVDLSSLLLQMTSLLQPLPK